MIILKKKNPKAVDSNHIGVFLLCTEAELLDAEAAFLCSIKYIIYSALFRLHIQFYIL